MPESRAGRAKGALIELLETERLVAVLRSSTSEHHSAAISMMLDGGIRLIELTLTASDALESLPRLSEQFGDHAVIGMGTVLRVEDAHASIDAGARYLVTPLVVPSVIEVAVSRGVPIIVGALTPTEIHTALACGADAIKIFPASAVSPQYLRELAGPLPGLAIMPSGGVAVDDVEPWLAAGATAVSLGGSLLGAAARGDLTGLAERVKRAVRATTVVPR